MGAAVFLGLLALCFLFALMVVAVDSGGELPEDGPRIGVVKVDGVITDTSARRGIAALRQFRKDDEVPAIVVRVDSPGGVVGPSQELYREIQRTRKTKPVVASMGSVAASGGYYLAAACSRIMASPGTITGSIGVITETMHVPELLALARVQTHAFTSGTFKDTGNPTRAMTDGEKAFMQGFVEAIHEQFVKAVMEGRKLDRAKVKAVADGRILTGEQAKAHGLVDELGNFSDALELAAKLGKAEGDPVPVYVQGRGGWLTDLLQDAVQGAARALVRELRPGARVEARDPMLK